MFTGRMGTDPIRTLQLLDELEALGFDNAAFKILHHKGSRGETINRHRTFCRNRKGHFVEGLLDSQVQERLRYVLNEYKAISPPPNDDTDVTALFRKLAANALREIPIEHKRGPY